MCFEAVSPTLSSHVEVPPLTLKVALLNMPPIVQADGEQGVFCEADQLLQIDADEAHAQLADLLNGSFASLCETKAVGEDRYYRLSNEKARTTMPHKFSPLQYNLAKNFPLALSLEICSSVLLCQAEMLQVWLRAALLCMQSEAW